ncbi:MAG TPA: DUF6036 family nucleotidyltransferase [Puia sp.]
MDIFDEQLLNLWKTLNSNDVKYIMVGGFATVLHGFSRNTNDIDLWLDDTKTNRKNLRKTFSELGYGDYESIETMDFVPGWTTFYAAGVVLDIMTKMKGLENLSFDSCFKSASMADVEGVRIPFLHINHLIENKKAVNRPKDQIDVQELEKIKNIKKGK